MFCSAAKWRKSEDVSNTNLIIYFGKTIERNLFGGWRFCNNFTLANYGMEKRRIYDQYGQKFSAD